MESQTVCEAEQSSHSLPWAPQVVLFPFVGLFTHALSLQHPSQFEELHCCWLHEGEMVAKPPIATPMKMACNFICLAPAVSTFALRPGAASGGKRSAKVATS